MWRKINKSTKQYNTKKETQTISKTSDPSQFANSLKWALVDGASEARWGQICYFQKPEPVCVRNSNE